MIGQKKSLQRVLDIVVGTPDRLMKMRTNGQVRSTALVCVCVRAPSG